MNSRQSKGLPVASAVLLSARDRSRRLYGELVRGRTRISVVTETGVAEGESAAFVLSPYRSGTTLLRYCLDSHPDLAVPPETDYLMPLSHVFEDAASMQGLADLGYDAEAVAALLASSVRRPLDVYAVGRGASQWCDKSPRYAERPAVVHRFFPQARYLLLHRHPLDQVNSFTKAGTMAHPCLGKTELGESVIRAAAAYWAKVTSGLMDFADTVGSSAHTMTYEDLCERPQDVLAGAVEHLELSWSADVLDYHRHDHDLGREAGRVIGTRDFRANTGRWKAWPASWVETAWREAGEVADRLGYER